MRATPSDNNVIFSSVERVTLPASEGGLLTTYIPRLHSKRVLDLQYFIVGNTIECFMTPACFIFKRAGKNATILRLLDPYCNAE